MAAGVGVVEEDGEWAEETASTPVGNETLTDTVAATNRESVLHGHIYWDFPSFSCLVHIPSHTCFCCLFVNTHVTTKSVPKVFVAED